MKRLRYCVICEKELEPGGRVDRKYCGVACTQAAYRLRHPEKQRPVAGRVRVHAAAVVRGQRTAGGLADSVAQVEEENASLRRELAALKARVAQQERATSGASDISRQLARERARAEQAESSVAELRAELMRAQQAGHGPGAEPIRQGGAGGERRHSLTQPSRRQERERASEQAALPATLQVVAAVVDDGPERVASTTARAGQPEAVRAPFPWEVPQTGASSDWMPYWGTSDDTIRWLEKEGKAALAMIPTQIYNRGERLKAREMREWIQSDPTFINELAEELAGRIVCTRRSERKNKQQKDQLALLAFRDAVDYLKKHSPERAERFDRDYSAHAETYEWMAREFVDAIEDRYFSDR